ncbi:DUF1156 domain-containing protein [Rhodococcus erythropolis]|uniref:DUF1156 domain-containing protein n=1 Tax=Rhodococcus erythropolis TaxID=1833 RepID=UPI001BABB9A1|nr:DUF1156 domain-containing protein [Rhodococcus erythropolis]MBS2993236.1 DUF1156 domain-containing protein [Rhodococcus erythropolis]
MTKHKLIEVSLPLEAINRESAKEKSRKVGKPQQIHHWWARRPITAARAMLFAQLVDDPSAHPDRFPTEGAQRTERARLHKLLERLAKWEAMADQSLLDEAAREIAKSADGHVPPILDPFAGGGTIPLEAQRLGLEAHASDLNPVAVLINKALIELPSQFRDQAPVFPGLADSEIRQWKGSAGLAGDVRAYGNWMRTEAENRLAGCYPTAQGMPVISWLWARTVTCPNPGCRIDMPLVRSWWLAKKRGKEAFLIPQIIADPGHASGMRVIFSIGRDRVDAPEPKKDGTVNGRTGAVCLACETTIPVDYLRAEGMAGRVGQVMTTIVAEGNRQRVYLEPDSHHINAANIARLEDPVNGEIADNPRWFSPPAYGMEKFADLFTSRQLRVLATLSDLVAEVYEQIATDGGSQEYAGAVATYLGLAVSRLSDWSGNMCRWEPNAEVSQQVFGQQSINMTWDFSEARALGERSSGSFGACLTTILRSLEQLNPLAAGYSSQGDAVTRDYDGYVINTDPPYYDNIGYSDLSDYFYLWIRRSLSTVYPDLLSTLLVPKTEELVANPYRHEGKEGAKKFFEEGFRTVFERARNQASSNYPMVVYYAFKQSETDSSGEASTGWETLLEGMIRGGWAITATWPIRTEGAARLIAQNTNALASSIVLSLRPRPSDSIMTDRRGFVATLEAELPEALRRLQQGAIAPVDLPQSAIGPGMAIFSRYSGVIESDGSKMTVRSALSRINEVLDGVLNEQEGDFDPTSRFAVAWYRQNGYDVGDYGDAELLANARGVIVQAMDRGGVLTSRGGKVQLLTPTSLPWDYNVLEDSHTSNWEALHHLIKVLERDGIAPAGDFLQSALGRPDGAIDADLLKELGHLLFRIAESNSWSKDALSFNALVTSWPEILEVAHTPRRTTASQGAFDYEDNE